MREHVLDMMQSVAVEERAGWLGRLELGFARRDGRTAMVRSSHVGPLRVQRAFYPEEDHPHVYILHPPGGVVGGDRLELSVEMEPGSHALLTMPGATKFYRSGGGVGRVSQRFVVGEGSVLEWLPQGNILFPGARVAVESEFQLAAEARLLGFETFCLGRPVMDEVFDSGSLDSVLRIGSSLYERLRLEGGRLEKVAGRPLVGTFFASPAREEMLEGVRALLGGLTMAGATLVDEILVVRVLEDDNLRLQDALHRIWALLRPMLLGRDAVPPRIWST